MKYVAVLIKDPNGTIPALKYQLSELFGEVVFVDLNNTNSVDYENHKNQDILLLETIEQLILQNRQLHKTINQYVEIIKEHRLKERSNSHQFSDLSEIKGLIENFERDLQENERQIQLLSFETDKFKEENFNLKNQLVATKEVLSTKELQLIENKDLIHQLKGEIQTLKNLTSAFKDNSAFSDPPTQAVGELTADHNEKVASLERFVELATRQIIELDKMAALGRIVAGVAHEINTPIGAINAASDNILKVFQPTLKHLPQLLKHLSTDDEELFYKLVDKTLQFGEMLSSREERQYKKSLTEELDAMNVSEAGPLAGQLVKIGVFNEVSQFERLFKMPQNTELIEMASNIGKTKHNLDNIKLAISKIVKIVSSLKNYSHRQVTDDFVEANISTNMDIVLNIHHNQLKYGVEVIKNYSESTPMIWCRPDELNQVWTNIIYNAIQAMKGQGSLWVDIEPDTDQSHIVVRITDSGPGIPEDVLPRIFEPFFTTKPQGEGTGLGLDICKRIVERHHGTISVSSIPGKTCFTVTLLINPKTQS